LKIKKFYFKIEFLCPLLLYLVHQSIVFTSHNKDGGQQRQRSICIIAPFIALQVLSSTTSKDVVISSSSYIFAEWILLDYTWDNGHSRQEYIVAGKFVPENCAMAGINVDKDGNVYVTVPRWRPGVPATLNKLQKVSGTEHYTLTPYPSWDMQVEGENGDLQNCQSMTIDSQGRMWVIEVGRRNFLASNASLVTNGAAGVWIIDMATEQIVSKYYFPNDVAYYNSSFVNDIVLDESRQLAYLSDAAGNGGLIVYNFLEATSRRYSAISTKNEPSYVMIIDGTNYGNAIFTTPSDGIAITPDNEAILYGAVQGTKLYRVPAEMLRNYSSTTADIDSTVELLGTKNPSDGFKFMNGLMYYGDLPSSCYHALYVNSTNYPNITAVTQSVPSDPETLRWVSLVNCGTVFYINVSLQ
jgi:hypothetical protein